MPQKSLLDNFKTTILRARPARADFEMAVRIWKNLNEEEMASLLELFEQEPDYIKSFMRHIVDKRGALEKNDLSAWTKVITQEEKELTKILL